MLSLFDNFDLRTSPSRHHVDIGEPCQDPNGPMLRAAHLTTTLGVGPPGSEKTWESLIEMTYPQ